MVIMESPVPARRKKNILAGCDQQEEVDAVSRGIPKLTKLADAMNIVTNNDKNNKGKGCVAGGR